MTPDEVKGLVEMARAAGLRRLKVDGVEFEFAPPAAVLPDPKSRPKGRPMPTGEDFLLWSTGEQLSYEQPPPTAAQRAAAPDAAPGKPN